MAELPITRSAGESFRLEIAGHHHPVIITIDGILRNTPRRNDKVQLTLQLGKSVRFVSEDFAAHKARCERRLIGLDYNHPED